jgi:dipeptidyl aminopeptidase/acylaminoacyl peptidase
MSTTKQVVWIVVGVFVVFVAALVLTCAGAVVLYRQLVNPFGHSRADINSPTPGLELQPEDFRDARKTFQTTLVHKGPAPQGWVALEVPQDARIVEFPSGGFRLRAWLSDPPGKKGQPAVLFLHGGYAYDEEDWDMAKPFRDAGFVVMAPILRGENGLAGNFTLFYDEVDDVLAAAERLAGLPQVDPKRIYVAGHSAGGTLTLLAALASDRFRAAASFGASPDQIQFCRFNPNLIVFDRRNNREFQMRSPVAYAGSFKCPVRIYAGDEDPLLHVPSQRTAMLARQNGLDVETLIVPGDHMTSVPDSIDRAIGFFKKQEPEK